MDDIQRQCWHARLRLQLHEKRGEAFQDLFADIMTRRHRGDFVRTRPWSQEGDRKNDGYLRSSRRLFQVYAPDEMSAKETIKKIKDDFAGALKHWDKHLSEWVFVHNARGLGPSVLNTLLDEIEMLHKANPSRKVDIWPAEALEPLVLGRPSEGTPPLPDLDIEALLGPAYTLADVRRVVFKDVQPLIDALAGVAPDGAGAVRAEVPLRKMEFNRLPPAVCAVLRAGNLRAHEVERYLRMSTKPLLGDRVANAYKQRYRTLRDAGHDPEEIYDALVTFTLSEVRSSSSREAAAQVVLSYFFFSCDIFEDAPVPALPAGVDPSAAPHEGDIVGVSPDSEGGVSP